jgi:hypothetical protein
MAISFVGVVTHGEGMPRRAARTPGRASERYATTNVTVAGALRLPLLSFAWANS